MSISCRSIWKESCYTGHYHSEWYVHITQAKALLLCDGIIETSEKRGISQMRISIRDKVTWLLTRRRCLEVPLVVLNESGCWRWHSAVIKRVRRRRAGGVTLLLSRWAVVPLGVWGDWLRSSLALLLHCLLQPYLLAVSLQFFLLSTLFSFTPLSPSCLSFSSVLSRWVFTLSFIIWLNVIINSW